MSFRNIAAALSLALILMPGLSRAEAGLGTRALVAEGYAALLAPGVYRRVGPLRGADDGQDAAGPGRTGDECHDADDEGR